MYFATKLVSVETVPANVINKRKETYKSKYKVCYDKCRRIMTLDINLLQAGTLSQKDIICG